MNSLLVATGNSHKAQEIQSMLGSHIVVRDLSSLPAIGEIIEDADTFEGNADIKALAVSAHTDELVLADDSGLCVEALNGEPGIYSARYAGEHADMPANKALLLSKLADHSNRKAFFVCVFSVAQQGKIIARFRGECHGTIIDQERGEGGFGYDPLFIPDGFTETFSELPAEKKNELSHRANAMSHFQSWLRSL